MSAYSELGLVFFQQQAKNLAGNNISRMTYSYGEQDVKS